MSITTHNKNNRGFTLIELIIAMSIGLVISMILLFVAVSGLKYVRETRQRERLQAEAIFLVNKFAFWIKQGTQLDVPNSSELQVKLLDATVKTFKKDGTKILLDGEQLVSDEVLVNNLDFTEMSRSVRIHITLSQSDASFDFTTTLAQRN